MSKFKIFLSIVAFIFMVPVIYLLFSGVVGATYTDSVIGSAIALFFMGFIVGVIIFISET